jgi:CheY-like chemotaxis protein
MAKILVVDDEPIVHRLMQHYLERAGYEMLAASNGREALVLATREDPQLIVMDVMMAEMDGLTALRALKKADSTKAIPVIMITANSHYATQQESAAAGAAVFLTKPFSPKQLLDEIRRLVPDSAAKPVHNERLPTGPS